MDRQEWGLFPEEAKNAVIYWGARAIITEGFVDLLPDRQSFCVAEGVSEERKKAFNEWINESALPLLNEAVKTKAIPHVRIEGVKRVAEADTHDSGGYLYIGAWEVD